MSGIGSPEDMGTPADIPASAPVHVEQNSNAPEAVEAEHAATPGNAPAIDPDATFIENQDPDGTIIEAPLSPDAAEIERVSSDLESAGQDAMYLENQSPEPKAGTAPRNPITFAGKPKDFYVDLVDSNDQPIPVAIPEAPPTTWQKIGQIASRFIPGK